MRELREASPRYGSRAHTRGGRHCSTASTTCRGLRPSVPNNGAGGAPSPQPQQRLQWIWSQYKWKILFFLGSVSVASLLLAVADPSTAGERVSYVVAFAFGVSLILLLHFIPIWVALGGLVYLVAQLLGRKPPFFRMVFDWWVTVPVVTPILIVAWASP